MNIPNNKKSEMGGGANIEIKIYPVRSWNMYENKENMDIMPDKKSDFYVEVTRFLQNIAGFERAFGLNFHFGDVPRAQKAGFRRHLAIPQARIAATHLAR